MFQCVAFRATNCRANCIANRVVEMFASRLADLYANEHGKHCGVFSQSVFRNKILGWGSVRDKMTVKRGPKERHILQAAWTARRGTVLS